MNKTSFLPQILPAKVRCLVVAVVAADLRFQLVRQLLLLAHAHQRRRGSHHQRRALLLRRHRAAFKQASRAPWLLNF